jgi:hypothetical protein
MLNGRKTKIRKIKVKSTFHVLSEYTLPSLIITDINEILKITFIFNECNHYILCYNNALLANF